MSNVPEWVISQIAAREAAADMAARRAAYDEWAQRVAADIAWMIEARYA